MRRVRPFARGDRQRRARGLGAADQAEFKRRAQIAHDWDKIILINPRDDTDSFEL